MVNAKSKMLSCGPAFAVAFFVLAFMGFQLLRERSASAAALVLKEAEIGNLQEELEEVMKAADEHSRMVSQLKAEKARLASDSGGLNSRLIAMERYKGSSEDKKRSLEDTLQNKEDEVDELKEQLAKLQHSSEQINELKQQVHELEEKLKAERSKSKSADADTDTLEEVDANKEGSGGLLGEEDDNKLDEETMNREADNSGADSDNGGADSDDGKLEDSKVLDVDLDNMNEHSDDGEQAENLSD